MAAVAFDESMVGASIRMTTPMGETVEGLVFGYDENTKMVCLEQFTGPDGKVSCRVLNTLVCTGIAVTAPAAPASSGSAAKLVGMPQIDHVAIKQRERRALMKAIDDAKHINQKATNRAQLIYDSLHKTMPCEWKELDILVLNEIRISPPYKPSSCTGKGAALNRVKKVLAGELTKLTSKMENI